MTDHIITLAPHEQHASLIVRPVWPQPFICNDSDEYPMWKWYGHVKHKAKDGSHTYTLRWFGYPDFPAKITEESPLGVPGDVLLGKEAVWMPTCLNCGTLKYVADHAQKPGYMYERVPAPRMPRDLIRFRLPVVEAGVMRAGEITERDAVLAGWPGPEDNRRLVMEVDGTASGNAAIQWFALAWNRRWGKRAGTFADDNPWMWWARVEEDDHA